jgi:uncharacterized protein (TIGR02284 family)
MKDEELIAALNELIESLMDDEKSFALAAKGTEEAELIAFFNEGEKCRRAGATELQDQVRLLGGVAEEDGSMRGAARRRWTSIKSAVSSRENSAILDECERGEDHVRARYAGVLKLDLPGPLRVIVKSQYREVVDIHYRVMDLRSRTRDSDARALRSNV